MKIVHVTPHLPPDQAANALLPAHLGRWAVEAGHAVTYVAHPPRAGQAEEAAGPVVWIAPHQGAGWQRTLRLSALAAARTIAREAGPVLDRADLVHIHSNGLLAETCAWLANRRGIPVVLTLYGTEIWHYRAKPWPFDLFTRMYRRAAAVTFYSRGLLDKAIEFGLSRDGLSVIYPPVVDRFAPVDAGERAALRAKLGLRARRVLLNVKRLHPLAAQRVLIEAMPRVLRQQPDTQLVICGTGALRDDLEQAARDAGVADRVTFAGLVSNAVVADYNRAADLFVLPSLLEALPTVAVEALACGTPVVSADHPGGVELHGLFGEDVLVVPKEDRERLADAIVRRLEREGDEARTTPETMRILEREFRPAAVAARFEALYRIVTPTKHT
jgi:glycosyltransferase involved in cell wall biosynthesis